MEGEEIELYNGATCDRIGGEAGQKGRSGVSEVAGQEGNATDHDGGPE